MSTSWWRKLLFTRPIRRTARPKLWVEPLEHRDTPAIYAAAVGAGSAPVAGASAVSVAVGDVNADGTPDVVAGAGTGGGPEVTVFDGKTGSVLLDEFAFEDTFRGGVHVSAGDVDGDGKADVTAGAGAGGGPRVVVLSGATGDMIRSVYAYDAAGRNGGMANVYVDGTGSAKLATV